MFLSLGGNFWSAFRGLQPSQAFEDLLNREDVTLDEVLDDGDVIQELKNHNSRLIELYITEFPKDDDDEKRCYKFPFISCELFSCEVPAIVDKFFSDIELLKQLFSLLSNPDINHTMVGYFNKVMSSLLNRNSAAIFEYVFSTPNMDALLDNICYRSIGDLISRILVINDTDLDAFWENRLDVIEKIFGKIEGAEGFEVMYGCSYVIQYLIDHALDSSLTEKLVVCMLKKEKLETLFDWYRREDTEGCQSIVTGILVNIFTSGNVKELLEMNCVEHEEEDAAPLMYATKEPPAIVRTIADQFPRLVEALKTDPEWKFVTQLRTEITPLGETRLGIINMILSALKLGFPEIWQEVVESDFLEIITELFFRYQWNSMLHFYYDQIITMILNGDNIEAKTKLLKTVKLPEKLIQHATTNANKQSGDFGTGNSGYFTKISNLLQKLSTTQTEISQGLGETGKWDDFYANVITPINKVENTKLGESQKLDNTLSDSDGETNDCFNFTNNIPDLHFSGDNNKEIEPDNELEEEFDDVLDRPMTEEELNDFEIELYSETSSGVVSQETDFFSNNYWRIPAAASQLEDLD